MIHTPRNFVDRMDTLFDLEEAMDDLLDEIRLAARLVAHHLETAAMEIDDLDGAPDEIRACLDSCAMGHEDLRRQLATVLVHAEEHDLLRPDTASDPCHLRRLAHDAILRSHRFDALQASYDGLCNDMCAEVA